MNDYGKIENKPDVPLIPLNHLASINNVLEKNKNIQLYSSVELKDDTLSLPSSSQTKPKSLFR